MKIPYAFQLFIFAASAVLITCKDESPSPPAKIEFELSSVDVVEDNAFTVNVKLEKALSSFEIINVKVTNNTASDYDYESDKNPATQFIGVPRVANQTTLSFVIDAKFDSKIESTEVLSLEIVEVPDGFEIGTKKTMNFNILDNGLGVGLVGEYLFSGQADDSSTDFDNHGTVFGASLTADRKGNSNNAYSFDGVDDYVSIPDFAATDFEVNVDFSISLWVNVNSIQPQPANPIYDILRKWSGDAQGYPFAIGFYNQNGVEPNKITVVRYDGAACVNSSTMLSPVLTLDVWHHIVMVKNGSTIALYFNNIKVSEVADNTICATSNTSHITVGCRGQLVRFFAGKIDDIRFYNRAVSASEVLLLFVE